MLAGPLNNVITHQDTADHTDLESGGNNVEDDGRKNERDSPNEISCGVEQVIDSSLGASVDSPRQTTSLPLEMEFHVHMQ